MKSSMNPTIAAITVTLVMESLNRDCERFKGAPVWAVPEIMGKSGLWIVGPSAGPEFMLFILARKYPQRERLVLITVPRPYGIQLRDVTRRCASQRNFLPEAQDI